MATAPQILDNFKNRLCVEAVYIGRLLLTELENRHIPSDVTNAVFRRYHDTLDNMKFDPVIHFHNFMNQPTSNSRVSRFLQAMKRFSPSSENDQFCRSVFTRVLSKSLSTVRKCQSSSSSSDNSDVSVSTVRTKDSGVSVITNYSSMSVSEQPSVRQGVAVENEVVSEHVTVSKSKKRRAAMIRRAQRRAQLHENEDKTTETLVSNIWEGVVKQQPSSLPPSREKPKITSRGLQRAIMHLDLDRPLSDDDRKVCSALLSCSSEDEVKQFAKTKEQIEHAQNLVAKLKLKKYGAVSLEEWNVPDRSTIDEENPGDVELGSSSGLNCQSIDLLHQGSASTKTLHLSSGKRRKNRRK